MRDLRRGDVGQRDFNRPPHVSVASHVSHVALLSLSPLQSLLSTSQPLALDVSGELVVEGEAAVVDADDLAALGVLDDAHDGAGGEPEAPEMAPRGVRPADFHDAGRFARLEE